MPAPITIRYDLDSGTLVQRGSQSPGASGAAEQDNFLGSLIALSNATFAPGDTQLTINVEFFDKESGVKQSLRLKDLGSAHPTILHHSWAPHLGSHRRPCSPTITSSHRD